MTPEEIVDALLADLTTPAWKDKTLREVLVHCVREAVAEVAAERDQYKSLFDKAMKNVDEAFQERSGFTPILPDFLSLGEDKFEGVVKLAKAYRKLEGRKSVQFISASGPIDYNPVQNLREDAGPQDEEHQKFLRRMDNYQNLDAKPDIVIEDDGEA